MHISPSRTLVALLAAVVLTGCEGRPGSEPAVAVAEVPAQVPEPLAYTFRRMDRELPAEWRDSLRATTPGTMVRWHGSIGLHVRNEYGLWRGGPLQDWFASRGVRYPDDMSAVLLEAYGAHLRDEPPRLDSLIAAVPPPPRAEPAPGGS